MIIDCISDLHGFYPKLPGGDLLIVSGDLTATDTEQQYLHFNNWLTDQDYKMKIVIAGNHDNLCMKGIPIDIGEEKLVNAVPILANKSKYLCDSGTEFEYDVEFPHPASTDHVSIDVLCYERRKLKIWGSPWTKTFPGMNPKCKAFTVDTEEELAEKWAMIPDDTDILITHSPPHGIFDQIAHCPTGIMENVGSISLLMKATTLPNLKLFVFGHIHESYGFYSSHDLRNFTPFGPAKCKSFPYLINASHVDENYRPVNAPIRIEL